MTLVLGKSPNTWDSQLLHLALSLAKMKPEMLSLPLWFQFSNPVPFLLSIHVDQVNSWTSMAIYEMEGAVPLQVILGHPIDI